MQIDEISEIVAERLGVDKEKVKRINRVQWRFLMENMQTGEFKPLSIFYIGKFIKNKRYENQAARRNLSRLQKPNL